MSWEEQAAGYSDEKLYKILSNPGDYDLEPFKAYEAEFNKRGLDREKVQASVKENEEAKRALASRELTTFEKIRLILNPLGLLVLFRIEKYRARGEETRYRQAYRYVGIGFLFYASVFLVVIHKNMRQ